MSRVLKLGGWDDKNAGKIAEETHHRVWATRGGNETTDISQYMVDIGNLSEWCGECSPAPTWKG